MSGKSRKIKTIFIVYWFLLLYVVSALVWWYIALSRQNEDIFRHRLSEMNLAQKDYSIKLAELEQRKKAKTAQYMGEGIIFFLLIGAGAIFLYRAVKKQLQLSEQQKNFMMAVTHELKTPIAVTKLNLETLQRRKLDEQQQQRLLQHALDETNRMNALCSNLLVSSQMESGKYAVSLERISLNELIQEMIRDFTNRFPERKVLQDCQEEAMISADTFLLQILVNNLLNNAHRYSPKDQPIEISVNKNKQKVTLSIIDGGKGIAEADRKKVFEKYYRKDMPADKQVKGTGLGLYIVKRITALLDAEINIEENKPSGCIFNVEFKSEELHVS